MQTDLTRKVSLLAASDEPEFRRQTRKCVAHERDCITVAQLRAVARSLRLRSSLKKSELVEAILERLNGKRRAPVAAQRGVCASISKLDLNDHERIQANLKRGSQFFVKLAHKIRLVENSRLERTTPVRQIKLPAAATNSVTAEIHEEYNIPHFMRPHMQFAKCSRVLSAGGSNKFYRCEGTDGKQYGVRITDPAASIEINGMFLELCNTVLLSELEIGPKVNDAFMVRIAKRPRFVVIGNYANRGDLCGFLNSAEFGLLPLNSVRSIVKGTQRLYHRIIDNNLYCFDVKPENMVVDFDGNYCVRLIDFDCQFCSRAVNSSKVKSAMYIYTMIQVGFIAASWCSRHARGRGEDQNAEYFCKALLKGIRFKDINSTARRISRLGKNWKKHFTPIRMLVYYLRRATSSQSALKIGGVYLDEEHAATLLYSGYMIAMVGLDVYAKKLEAWSKTQKKHKWVQKIRMRQFEEIWSA